MTTKLTAQPPPLPCSRCFAETVRTYTYDPTGDRIPVWACTNYDCRYVEK